MQVKANVDSIQAGIEAANKTQTNLEKQNEGMRRENRSLEEKCQFLEAKKKSIEENCSSLEQTENSLQSRCRSLECTEEALQICACLLWVIEEGVTDLGKEADAELDAACAKLLRTELKKYIEERRMREMMKTIPKIDLDQIIDSLDRRR